MSSQYVDLPLNTGVESLNGLTGNLTLVAGANITITPSGSNITIAATGGGGGSGTVTSVALADSTGLFNISGSPVTTSGTLTLASLQNQVQNTFFAAPTGSSGAPTFRLIDPSDLPTLPYISTTLGASATTGGLSVTGHTLFAQQSSGSLNGWLSSTDWTTFNSKQAAGSYITALTGDVTASGPGSATASLVATTNSTITTLSALSLPTSQLTGPLASPQWRAPVNTATSLPPSGNTTGDAIIAKDTQVIYIWNGSSWTAEPGTGTVTSVAMTVPTFLSVAGSPITGAGTLAVTLSGTALPIANGGTGGTSVTTARANLGIEDGATFITTTGAGTYTTPSTITTVTQFKFTLVGGGASGGSDNAAAVHTTGGGGGAVCILYVTGLTASTGYTISVAASIAGGTSTNTGNNGNNTTLVIGTTTYTAGGGSAAAATTGPGGAGGTATNGTINITGGAGGSSMGVATSGGQQGGNAAMGWGMGGVGNGPSVSAAGNAGTNYGGGGSGASGTGGNSGGGGAQGCILVEYTN